MRNDAPVCHDGKADFGPGGHSSTHCFYSPHDSVSSNSESCSCVRCVGCSECKRMPARKPRIQRPQRGGDRRMVEGADDDDGVGLTTRRVHRLRWRLRLRICWERSGTIPSSTCTSGIVSSIDDFSSLRRSASSIFGETFAPPTLSAAPSVPAGVVAATIDDSAISPSVCKVVTHFSIVAIACSLDVFANSLRSSMAMEVQHGMAINAIQYPNT